jgi:hypothetical protein
MPIPVGTKFRASDHNNRRLWKIRSFNGFDFYQIINGYEYFLTFYDVQKLHNNCGVYLDDDSYCLISDAYPDEFYQENQVITCDDPF